MSLTDFEDSIKTFIKVPLHSWQLAKVILLYKEGKISKASGELIIKEIMDNNLKRLDKCLQNLQD